MSESAISYQLFSMKNPEAAAFLSSVEEVAGFEMCETDLHEANLKDVRQGETRLLYDRKGAYTSAFEWRQQFHLFKVDLLVVFGIGLGWEWCALEPWLNSDPKRELVFLEDDLSILYHFLNCPFAEKILSHPQTSVYYIDGKEIGRRVYELLAWNSYRKTTRTVATEYYRKYRSTTFEQLDRKIKVVFSELSSTLDEFYTFGSIQFRSFFRNILTFPRARMGADLFGSFSRIPAIVVAAGPSLEGCLADLKKVGDKAVIISGGTATNILLENGIRPHFCSAVDPNPTQYLRLKQIHPFTIPLFYQSRILPEGIQEYQGELLYLRGGNGQPLIEWFDKAIGISEKIIDGGHSVSNMIIEIAHNLGCSPIIMAGYDLSYPAGKMYPSSVKEALTSAERLAEKEERRGTHGARSNSGKEVRTEEKWIIEASWISRYKKDHPHMQLYNTSLDGLFIDSVPAVSFQELMEKFLSDSQSIDARVHRSIMTARRLPFSRKTISKAFGALAKTMKECEAILAKLAHGRDALLEYELRDNLSFRFFLSIYDKMFEKKIEMHRLFKEQELLDPERRETLEKQMFEEKIHFLSDGLKELSVRICEFVGIASYEGFFLENGDPIRALETRTVPKWIQKTI